jgi:hypothetical protein
VCSARPSIRRPISAVAILWLWQRELSMCTDN